MASDEVAVPPNASQGRSFLTSLKGERDRPYSKRVKTVLETIPGAGPRILETHDELKNLAENMDKKVNDVLREHEADFFLAYKTHMYGLQKEFKSLKAKADEEDAKTRRDLKIQNLERELDWFMAEALRLDELCKGYKKEVDKWKAKAEAIEEDRRFLEDQIKGSKRQNKVLRAAVERASYSAKFSSPKNPLSPTKFLSGEPREPLSLPPLRPHSADGTLGNQLALENDGRQSAPPDLTTEEQLAIKSPEVNQSVPSEEEQKLIDAVKTLKEHVKREKLAIRAIRMERASAYAKKSALEEFFLDGIDQSRKDLARKRRPGGPQPQNEQEKIRELLLSSEDVLVYLYEKLFPHRAGMVQEIQMQALSILA